MTIRDLIAELEKLAKQFGDRTPIGFVRDSYGYGSEHVGPACFPPSLKPSNGFIQIER